jgi:hypothetical protein
VSPILRVKYHELYEKTHTKKFGRMTPEKSLTGAGEWHKMTAVVKISQRKEARPNGIRLFSSIRFLFSRASC